MSFRDVLKTVQSFDGMPDTFPLDTRASQMSVGDLRTLVKMAQQVQQQTAPDLIDRVSEYVATQTSAALKAE